MTVAATDSPPATGPPAATETSPSDIDALRLAVSQLEARVARLEGSASPAPRGETMAAPSAPPAIEAGDLGAALGLAGRSLVALGGGYLLRAAAETGALPGGAGAAAGLLYACAWAVAGHHALVAGRTASGLLGGATAVLVAYPLLWESVTRFHSLGPRAALAAGVALAFATGALGLRHAQPAMAWAHASAASLLALALLVSTHDLPAAVLALAALHAGAEAARSHPGTRHLGWLTAGPLLAALLAVVDVAGRPGYSPLARESAGLLVLGCCLAVLLWTGRRSWREPLTAFDVVVASLTLLLAVGAITRLVPLSAPSICILALVGAAAMDAALVLRRTFPAHSAAGWAGTAAVLTVASTSVLLSPALRVVAWCLGALAATARGRMVEAHRITGVALAGAALVASGAFVSTTTSLLDRSAPLDLDPVALLAAVTGVLCWALHPGAGAAVVGVFSAVALLLDAVPSRGPTAAAGGTLALAVLATALILLARRVPRPDVPHAATALLWAGGVRLLLVDMPGGTAAPLFVSLASYGAALMLAARLRRPGPPST